MKRSKGRRFDGTSGRITGSSASRRRTRILALNRRGQECTDCCVELLEPNGCKVVASAVPHDNSATTDPFDIVIVDLESLHLDVISASRARVSGCADHRDLQRISRGGLHRRSGHGFRLSPAALSGARSVGARASSPSCGNSKQKGSDDTTAAGRSSSTCSFRRSSGRANRWRCRLPNWRS